ncbi:MAG: hypothetical protein Q8Q06_01595 [bacterium]|nr:hypothetical protein [bacterium]
MVEAIPKLFRKVMFPVNPDQKWQVWNREIEMIPEISFAVGGCESCNAVSGEFYPTEKSARASLVAVVMAQARPTYRYGNELCTGAPIPEPPDGYQVAVFTGYDSHGSTYEEFFAIPRGKTLAPAGQNVEVREISGYLWVRGGCRDITPPGTLIYKQAGHSYTCSSPEECPHRADWMENGCDYIHLAEKSEWVPYWPTRPNW